MTCLTKLNYNVFSLEQQIREIEMKDYTKNTEMMSKRQLRDYVTMLDVNVNSLNLTETEKADVLKQIVVLKLRLAVKK